MSGGPVETIELRESAAPQRLSLRRLKPVVVGRWLGARLKLSGDLQAVLTRLLKKEAADAESQDRIAGPDDVRDANRRLMDAHDATLRRLAE